MKNHLQSNALEEQLAVLRKAEKKELKEISGATIFNRAQSRLKIKFKYFQLRREVWGNNYSIDKNRLLRP